MSGSNPKQASERSVVAAAFAAIALFVVSWMLLHVGFYRHKQLIDTPVYQRYGNAIADGKVPYRDFELVLTHWSWLYIPWFFPFVVFALLWSDREQSPASV